MKLWNDENEKFALMREKLYTPVVTNWDIITSFCPRISGPCARI